MEILLQQRFVSAKIDLIRDYCKLEDKSLYDGSWGLFSEYPKKFVPLDLIKRDGRGSNAKFFSHKLKTTEDTRHNTMFEHVGVFETQSDRHIKQHYNNPFAQVKVSILERSIIKRGNKVSIKSMLYSKTRQFNHTLRQINNFDWLTHIQNKHSTLTRLT